MLDTERRLTAVETVLRLHVESCDKRMARVEKLMWVLVSGAFGIVIKWAIGFAP